MQQKIAIQGIKGSFHYQVKPGIFRQSNYDYGMQLL